MQVDVHVTVPVAGQAELSFDSVRPDCRLECNSCEMALLAFSKRRDQVHANAAWPWPLVAIETQAEEQFPGPLSQLWRARVAGWELVWTRRGMSIGPTN